MKIIFFSRVVSKTSNKNYKTTIPITGPDDNYNQRLIMGVRKNNVETVAINFMPFHTFPVGRFFRYHRNTVKDRELGEIINVDYINLPLFKSYSMMQNIISEVKKIIGKNESAYIVIYDYYSMFLDAGLALKKWNKNIQLCLITPSIPGRDVPRKDIKHKMNLLFTRRLIEKSYEMDSYVFLTEQMNDLVNIRERPYIVIEGILPESIRNEDERCNIILQKYKVISQKYFLYTGRLDKIYHVNELVNAFLNMKTGDISLLLCGVGDYVNELKIIAKKNNKIVYGGFLDRESISILQNNALALVNPRGPEGEFTKYSFPSKTMEYLSTGRPVITAKLPGIPDEYDEHLIYIREVTEQGIKKCMQKVMDDIDSGKELVNQTFRTRFLESKTMDAQGKKLLDMIMR